MTLQGQVKISSKGLMQISVICHAKTKFVHMVLYCHLFAGREEFLIR